MENNKREIKNIFWNKEQEVLSQISNEYQAWLLATRQKRARMRNDLNKYYVEATKKNKVNVHSIYTTMQTLMSVHYTDKATVKFTWRTETADKYAQNLNKIARFDYEEMDLDKINYQWYWDAFFHWVGIKTIEWWDDITKTPIARVRSPLSWIPDPEGWFSIETHRWAWFEAQATKAELRSSNWYYNIDLINDKPEQEQDLIRMAYKEGRDMWYYLEDVDENKMYDIYHHFTRIKWQPYLITTANSQSLIIRAIKIEAVLEEEKKDPYKINFPIALKYFSPVKWDVYWISVPDLLRDKQSAESKLINLTLIQAQRNAFWDDKIYNPKKIKNIKDLQTPTPEWKYIAANVSTNEPLTNAITTVPKNNPWALPFNVDQKLDYLEQLSTWMSKNSLWVNWQGNMTATEAQQIQKNANLRFILASKVWLWWEKTFWQLWYRSYIYNLKKTDKKVLYITHSFGNQYFEFKKKDFETKWDLRIEIKPKSQIEEEDKKYKNDLYATAPQMLADPTTPTVGKLLLKRKMLKMAWLSDEEIQMITFNPDEQRAYVDLELINNNMQASEPKEGDDNLLFISILEWAEDNKYKFEAINKRYEAYNNSLEKKAQQAGQVQNLAWQWKDNTMMNIASANASSMSKASINKAAQEAGWNSIW